ncbi:rust resistance kinase Lr10 isoform X3 [Glycine max]|uniref:rust resistance kinase Lr10 isoform X3 n=1 Tax=Glycine max TaxID=3847 RepID=UPI001B3552CC|nr:rust resistance kinase Lr10 isoform X3 [Glycine max]
MWRERALLVILLLLLVQQICATKKQDHGCPLSSCGKITNITYPFRLKGHPKSCGDNRYELACENNVTVLHLYSGKYHVQAINYNNFTIRVVDPGVDQQTNCSSLPRYFLSRSNFTDTYNYRYNMDPYQAGEYSGRSNWDRLAFQHIVYMNCSNPVTQNGKYVDTASYVNWDSKDKYIYAIAGDLKAEDFQVGCHVKLVALTSWWGLDTNNYSYAAMHTGLVYGFEISWMRLICDQHCPSKHGCDDCFFDSVSQELNYWNGNSLWSDILVTILYTIFTLEALIMLWAWKILLTVPLFIVILTCKWRKRHLSMFESIENYLEQNNLMPIRYSYKEVKKMAGGFKDKLGEGGYGSVFKGKLRSGSCVAIKMLGKSKGNGQDFISEVATIGRTYHQNIVQLIGFCVHGSKRALVYEFMPNGSLDKFIFSKDESIHLSYDRIYNISIGVARGIAYLHYGCEMQILHFDIKPHNILLDENFTPKVSDFGLAKLYPIDNSIVPRTAARGTIGYMAPELFYNNIGGISHKADVYSYGMLLMEMAGKRKNLNPHAERSSQLFFPFWIYNHIRDGEDIEMEDVTKEEKKMVKKMIIVALWCIQLKPNDRPSMNEVVEMLEGDIENLEIPPKPTLYPSETITKN